MKHHSLPADVVGVIAEFTAESGSEAFRLARVASTWLQGVQGADELWDRLSFEQWGGRKRRGGFPMFRARMTAALAYRPLEPAQLHAIEDCDFAFKCPLVAEALKPTGRISESGNPVLQCDVCDEDVCVVSCQEECGEGRCVVTKPQDLQVDKPEGSVPIILYSEEPRFSQWVKSTLRRDCKRTVYGALVYTINVTQMVVGQLGADLIHFTDELPSIDTQKHYTRVFYQGDGVPPVTITGGIPTKYVVKVNGVEDAVKKISQVIDFSADMVFGFY